MDNLMKQNSKWVAVKANGSSFWVCELQPDSSYMVRSTVESLELAITMAQALNDREDFLVRTP